MRRLVGQLKLQCLRSQSSFRFSNNNDNQLRQKLQMYMNQKNFEMAKQTYQQIIDMNVEQYNQYNYKNKSQDLIGLGFVTSQMGWFQNAIEIYKQSERVAETDEHLIHTYSNMGICYMNMQEPQNSLNYFQKSVEIQQKANFESMNQMQRYSYKLSYIQNLKYLAELKQMMGLYAESENYMKEMLQLILDGDDSNSQSQSAGQNSNSENLQKMINVIHQSLFHTLRIYSRIAQNQQECFNILLKALSFVQSYYGVKDPNSFWVSYMISEWYHKTQQFQNCINYTTDCIKDLENIENKTQQVSNLIIQNTMIKTKSMVFLENYDQAISHLEQFEENVKHLNVADPKYVVKLLESDRAQYLRAKGDLENSYQNMINIIEEIIVQNDYFQSPNMIELLANVYIQAIQVSFDIQNYDENITLCQDYIQLLEKTNVLRNVFKEKTNAWRCMALSYMETNDLEKAEDIFTRTIQMCQTNEGTEMIIDNCYLELSMVYQKMKDQSKYEYCLNQCLQIRRKNFKEQDEAVISILELLEQKV